LLHPQHLEKYLYPYAPNGSESVMNTFFHHDVYGGGLGLGLGLDLDHLGILADLPEAQSVNVWAGQEELSTAVRKAVDIVEAEDMVSVLRDMVVFVVVVAI
jgi:hypothetical protein